MPMSKHPNFLLIITDQQRADHLGCYGNSVVQTPNIDGLAAAGTRFDRFYVATPICMPNRATLMTGRMPSLHGARQNGIPLSLTATTFVDILRAAGYDTVLVGKCHLQSINGTPPVIGMPQSNSNRIAPPEHLREADKSINERGRYDQELPSTWEREPEFEPTFPIMVSTMWNWRLGTVIKPSDIMNDGSKHVIRIPSPCAEPRISFPETIILHRRLGARECRKNSIQPLLSRNAPSITWRHIRVQIRVSHFSFSVHFPIRIIHSHRRANTGICMILNQSHCRHHSIQANDLSHRTYSNSMRSES